MTGEPKYSLEEPKEIKESTKTLKLDSRKSRFAQQNENRQAFEKKADEVQSKMVGRQEEIFMLGSKFIDMMKDKTLPENKGPLQQSLEKETLGKLINFAVDLNNDLDEPKDGMGSVGLLTLVFRSVMMMRDRNNMLEYKVEQLEKQLKSSATPSSHDK